MSKNLLKLLLWAAIFAIGTLLSYWLLLGITGLISYFQQGADVSSALHNIPALPSDLTVRWQWLPDDPDTGRQMEPFTRVQIESSYLRAWLQWNLSYTQRKPYGLTTYFSGPALADLDESIKQSAANNIYPAGWKVTQVDNAHNLQLHFYSADGSIVSLTDQNALVMETIQDSKNALIYSGENQASYDVVMFLEDGYWRIRHLVRTGTQPNPEASLVALQTAPGFVGIEGNHLVLDGQPFIATGINYYPQSTPWDLFWPKYTAATTDQDFKLIQSLGLNTIRIFVPFDQFGGSKPDPLVLDKLEDLLGRANNHGLRVIVTLFDFRTDYSPWLWSSADRQLEALLTRFRDNPTILAWDLKNEPDRDYSAAGFDNVNNWLRHTAQVARSLDPHHPLTIGWSTPAAALVLINSVDFVSFHFYAPAATLPAQLTTLNSAAANRPIMVTEFGLPTWNSPFFPNGHSEFEQAEYYADILNATRSGNVNGTLAWTLYDFTNVPATVAGRYPWQTGPQKYLGVVRADGTLKPAAKLLAPDAALDVTRLPIWARFFKPFWLTVVISLSVLGWLGFQIYRRKLYTKLAFAQWVGTFHTELTFAQWVGTFHTKLMGSFHKLLATRWIAALVKFIRRKPNAKK